MSTYDYDLFVIGAGSGGVRLARMSAAKGMKVAVAEDRYLGGTCVNVGCVPKKLFVYASEVNEQVEDSAGYGWSHDGTRTFDWSTLLTNKNTEITRLNGIYKNLLENSGAVIINGRARFLDNHTVVVGDQQVTAERIVIATGSWPFVPDFPGKDLAITSNEFFFLDQLPEKALVLGGGYIAVEMAGIMAGLGVETTLVYRGEMFLRGFDEEIRHFVKEEVLKKGIKLLFNDNIASLQKNGGDISVTLESGNVIASGLVLCATGRRPHLQDLGLDNVEVELNAKGEVVVDDHYRTSVDNIFALGDVTGGMQLTPVALAEGMYLSDYLYGRGESTPLIDYTNIATAVFCQPNIGTVGLSEEQAINAGMECDVYVSSFKALKHTLSGSEERCMMKLIVNKVTDKVVGAHMVGHEAGEIIQGIAVAIKAGATKSDFDSTIGIHPTSAEEFVTMRTARS